MGGNITKVLPGLYVGANENVKSHEELMENCISHILSVQTSSTEITESPSHLHHQMCTIGSDDCGLLRILQNSNDFIHSARTTSGNVLVHSESGTSANIAVVAAYLMTVYHLDFRTALNALQGIVNAAQPTHNLQCQLERFGSVSSPRDGDSPSDSLATAERSRLEEKFGTWSAMESDRAFLDEALLSYQAMKASGVILGEVEISSEAVISETVHDIRPLSPIGNPLTPVNKCADLLSSIRGAEIAPPASVQHGIVPPSDQKTNLDGDLFLEQGLEDLDLNPLDAENVVFETLSSKSPSPAASESDTVEDEVAGSIPVPRSLFSHSRVGASYRPLQTKFDFGIDVASLMPDRGSHFAEMSNARRTASRQQPANFSTTAPASRLFDF